MPQLERTRTTDTGILLTASDLSVGRAGTRASSTIDVAIRRGRTTAVVGPNGAGKSTLALTLGGLLAPGGGRLEAAADFAPDKRGLEPIRWRSKELLTRIGSVFQDPEHQFLAASVRDELAIGPRALKRDPQTTTGITDELLARLRLEHLADANPYTLSGGEKRRLSVATVLATQPELIILDEPTFGQDRRTWEELVKLIAEIVDAGTAVVAVSHDEDFVSLLADDVLELPAWEPRPARRARLAEVTP